MPGVAGNRYFNSWFEEETDTRPAMKPTCELINTYEVLEHVMGISGLHPHRLDTVRAMRRKLVNHVMNHASLGEGVVLDIGCGSGAGTRELANLLTNGQRVIGLDINDKAIGSARRLHGAQANLSFYHGDLRNLLADNPGLRISAAMSISVSMFISELVDFYSDIYHALLDGGLFIDAPFMFRNEHVQNSEEFTKRTYAACGCNMKMFHRDQLEIKLREAGFHHIESIEHDFDLMKLSVLFKDYRPQYLFSNFLRNVVSPPPHFSGISSRYLFSRTSQIFFFFLKHRRMYSSGEFITVKSMDALANL
ncbi:MAG TPA: class I SAM-dependent methyltransferase [Gallionellaceae bacterium]|nr:class I SAM-dependent methyltransferase [Gallionellaceae bacterium]